MADNPFVRYRTRLDSYRRAVDRGWSDDRYLDLVDRLDAAVAAVEGHGFAVTPLDNHPRLHPDGHPVWVKDDTRNVGGSHKSRHLFGVALSFAVDGDGNGDGNGELAIASCGNAAIAASVLARAMNRPLRVFVPTWADQAIVDVLVSNGAQLETCARQPDEIGDPTYLRFMEAVRHGSIPFSVQSTATPTTIDGGRTMGWELADQLIGSAATGDLGLFVQIGGGALAGATWQGLTEGLAGGSTIQPILYAVQTEACAPLARAWDRLMTESAGDPATAMAMATADPDRFMWPWEQVGSSDASGILDDVTYDWLPVVEGMLASGGHPIVVDETTIMAAHERGRAVTGIDVEATGTAGYAGLLALDRAGPSALLFTGVTRF